MCFKEVVEEWLIYKRNSVKESTYCNYLFKVEKYLYPELENENIDMINNYNGFIENLSNKLSPKTVRDIVILLKEILKYYEEEYETNLKVKRMNLPKIEKSNIRILTKNERKKIEDYCIKENSLKSFGIIICLNTGLRIGEICALKWENIDFTRKVITVEKTLQRLYIKNENKSKIVINKPKSSCSIREIPMNSTISKLLKKLSKNYKPQDYVLSGNDKIIVEPRNYQHYFKVMLKRSKVNVNKFHVLRHTFATNCIKAGMDVKSLSEILGHSDVDITLNVYVHSSIETKMKFLEKI